MFLAQALGVGLGSGLCYLPSLAMLARYFHQPAARACAMGIAIAGGSIGGLIHPILLNQLFHGVSSEEIAIRSIDVKSTFARGVRASAGLVAGMQVVAVVLICVYYPRQSPGTIDGEEELGSKSVQKKQQEIKQVLKLVRRFAADWPYVCFVFG